MFDKETILNLLQNQFLSAGIILSGIAGIILSFKQAGIFLWKRIKRKFLFTISIEETDELFLYFERWLRYKYPDQYRNMIASLRTVNNNYNSREAEIPYNTPNEETEKIDNKKDEVKYKQFVDTIFIKYKGSIITINKNRDKLEHAKDLFSLFFGSYKISILFFRKKLNTLLDDVVEYNQQFKPKDIDERIHVYSHTDYGEWYVSSSKIKPKNIDNIVLNEKNKNEIIGDIDKFYNSKDWYLKRAIPYKRGHCYYGMPGNGKTSLALSLAKKYKKDVYVLSLNELKDSNVKRLFKDIRTNSILLIEDIDASFDGRKSLKKELSFSNLLQCLDGVFYNEDMFLIITTNHIEKLDPALLRDGRIDLKVEINNPDRNLIKKYIELFFDVKLNGYLDDFVYDAKYSMSKIQNICLNSENAEEAINNIFEIPNDKLEILETIVHKIEKL